MSNPQSLLRLFGTLEPPPSRRHLRAGPLSADIDDGALRRVRFHGVEVVRGLNCLVRDAHWGTFAAEAAEEHVSEDEAGFSYERRFAVADGAASCRFTAKGRADGQLHIEAEITAIRDLVTCRSGLTVLHPIQGVAGTPLDIHHSDGQVEPARFPDAIQPSQPAFEIVGLTHAVDGITVDIRFAGEIFEMEDQRNWSDASFKTYCRPLSLPSPFTIQVGETIRQTIDISFAGKPQAPTSDAPPGWTLTPGGETMPDLLLALEPGYEADAAALPILGRLGPMAAMLRVSTEIPAEALEPLAATLRDRELDVEAVIPQGAAPDAALARLADTLRAADLRPARLLALPEPYLMSHQPSGPWPTGPTPADAAAAARAAFPDTSIGGGMLTSFTELNRCRPDAARSDYVSHGTTAIVHAADDASVMETLEALPAIFASTRALLPGKPYRLGLLSIGMRRNAYGPEKPADPEGRRGTMAKVDPRQRGLFAAAWAVGVMAATAGQGVEALSLAAPTGPFGLLRAKSDWPQPLYDETQPVIVYPLFHVVRALVCMAGKPRLAVAGLPPGLALVATAERWILANLEPEPQPIELPLPARLRLLDAAHFIDAAIDADWTERAATSVTSFDLGPYAVAFLDFSGVSHER